MYIVLCWRLIPFCHTKTILPGILSSDALRPSFVPFSLFLGILPPRPPVPKAGGSSIKDAMGGCHRFVQATEFGVTDGHISDTVVAIVYPAIPGVADTDRSPFVNIDSTTVAGIQRARDMGFADAQLADVVVSPFVFELNELFTPTARGRLFSVFRHPIERAVCMFYYIRVADWEPSYKPELKDWTLEQYAVSEVVENNWMTRQLSNKLGGELTDDDLKSAMIYLKLSLR